MTTDSTTKELLAKQYLIDRLTKGLVCSMEYTLATVDQLCMKKSASMNELRRQISIAQKTLTYILEAEYVPETQDGRVWEVYWVCGKSVFKYAQNLRNYWHPNKPLKEK